MSVSFSRGWLSPSAFRSSSGQCTRSQTGHKDTAEVTKDPTVMSEPSGRPCTRFHVSLAVCRIPRATKHSRAMPHRVGLPCCQPGSNGSNETGCVERRRAAHSRSRGTKPGLKSADNHAIVKRMCGAVVSTRARVLRRLRRCNLKGSIHDQVTRIFLCTFSPLPLSSLPSLPSSLSLVVAD